MPQLFKVLSCAFGRIVSRKFGSERSVLEIMLAMVFSCPGVIFSLVISYSPSLLSKLSYYAKIV